MFNLLVFGGWALNIPLSSGHQAVFLNFSLASAAFFFFPATLLYQVFPFGILFCSSQNEFFLFFVKNIFLGVHSVSKKLNCFPSV